MMRLRTEILLGMTLVALAGCSRDGGDVEPDPGNAVADFVPPRDTDILLADLTWSGATASIGQPTNLTQRVDYDNQPHFTPDGSGLWYTANDPQNGQADIWRYDFAQQMVTRVTSSAPESEYSATPLPDGSGISVIRVEADSLQRLWRFDGDGRNGEVLMPDLAPVGYHKWADEYTLVMFVLGQPPTLQQGDIRTGRTQVIAENIGRSIHKIPGSSAVSFVQRHDDGTSTVMRLTGDGSDPTPIIDAIDGGDFHAWAPNGTLFMASGSLVYARANSDGAGWDVVADFSDLNLAISRLAVSPDGSQIAMVAELTALDGFPGN